MTATKYRRIGRCARCHRDGRRLSGRTCDTCQRKAWLSTHCPICHAPRNWRVEGYWCRACRAVSLSVADGCKTPLPPDVLAARIEHYRMRAERGLPLFAAC